MNTHSLWIDMFSESNSLVSSSPTSKEYNEHENEVVNIVQTTSADDPNENWIETVSQTSLSSVSLCIPLSSVISDGRFEEAQKYC